MDIEDEEEADNDGKAAESEQADEEDETPNRPEIAVAVLPSHQKESKPPDILAARRVDSIRKISSSSAGDADESVGLSTESSSLLTSSFRTNVRKLDKVEGLISIVPGYPFIYCIHRSVGISDEVQGGLGLGGRRG